jgi:hypothetical protein
LKKQRGEKSKKAIRNPDRGFMPYDKQSFLWCWFWLQGINLRSIWTNPNGLAGKILGPSGHP